MGVVNEAIEDGVGISRVADEGGRVEDGRGSLGHWASLRFPSHRVTGGGHPPPVPTERGVRISRTNALRQLLHSTASACSSEYGRRSLGVSNGVRSLIWLKASQVRRRPAQLRLHNIRRQQRSTTRYTLTRLRRFPATP